MDKDYCPTSKVKVRMPAVLVPAYNALMKTAEGSSAMKRIKVGCGICKSTKYYGITRGVTRVASVIACENCRHFYQKIRREPVSLNCISEDKSSCYRSETFLETKCKACWVMRLLDCCPHDVSVYESISKLLTDDCKKALRGVPILPEELSDENAGSLSLEVFRNDSWVPAPSGEYDDLQNFDEQSGNDNSNSSDLFDNEHDLDLISKNLSIDKPSNDLSKSLLHEEFSNDIHMSHELKDDLNEKQPSKESVENHFEKDSSKEVSNNLSITSKEVIGKEAANKAIFKNVPAFGVEDENQHCTKFQHESEKSKHLSVTKNISQNVSSQNSLTSNIPKTATISSQDFDVEMEEEEEVVDDPAPVDVGIVTRRQKESNEEENGLTKKSERIKRKRKAVEYFNKPAERTGRRMKGLIHGPNGELLKNGKNLCDCLQEDCPGCHFPCPKCRSTMCGNECRVNRRWYYERVEVEGTKICFINKFAPKM